MSSGSVGQLSSAVQLEIADRFSLSPQTFSDLEGYESIVFAAGDTVVKVFEASCRNKNELLAEILFVNHLAVSGVSVARALPSKTGEWVEEIYGYLVVSFARVSGNPPTRKDASPELFSLMGKTLGKMHAATKSYAPAPGQRRNDWYSDSHVKNWHRNLERDDPLRPVIEAQLEQLLNLHTGPDTYGLIHADFHSDNFLVAGGGLTVIDFGDCLYGWFAMDIATAMFYFRRFLKDGHEAPLEAQSAFAALFYRHFIAGYLEENTLGSNCLGRIPIFLRWRYTDLYLYLHQLKQSVGLDGDEQQALSQFREIIRGNTIVELEWESLAFG